LLCPLLLLRELCRYLLGKTEKGRSSDCFSVLASLSVYRCDLTFAYDVISILHVLFVFNKKNNNNKIKINKFGENLQDFFFFLAY
jgi:hypothetical protein